MEGRAYMTKLYSGLIKVITILLAVTIMIINVYPLVKGVELFASARIVTNILFLTMFSLTGITKLRNKNKIGFYYLAFVLVMLIIFYMMFMTKK